MLLSTKNIAEKLGFSQGHVRFLIRTGKLKAQRVGNMYIIDKTDLKGLKRLRSPNGTRKEND